MIRVRIVLSAVVFALAGCREPMRIYAEVDAAPGLREGASVSFRGVPVGIVEKVAFSDSGVRLTLTLTRSDVPLHAADLIRVRPNGVFGDMVVEIIPGAATAPALAPGGTLSMAPGDTISDLRRAVADAMASHVLRQIGFTRGTDSTSRPSRASDSTQRARRP